MIRCGHCWKQLDDGEEAQDHFEYCAALKKSNMMTRRSLDKKKRKKLLMPDMTKSGEFPPKNESLQERIEACKSLAKHIAGIKRPETNTTMRVLREVRECNSLFNNFLRKAYPISRQNQIRILGDFLDVIRNIRGIKWMKSKN